MVAATVEGLPKGMEHVDRKQLLMSLPVRVQYLQQFLEFGPEDVAALVEGQKHIKAIIPSIVERVWEKLLRHDITARVFSTRDSRREVNPETWMRGDDPQIKHQKMFLRWYLTKLNSDPTKMEYWQYLDKVGMMHVGKGRPAPLHVDYIFLGACLGYVQGCITEAVLMHPDLALADKLALVQAVGKVVWIQNDLLAKWHMADAAESKGDAERDDGSSESEQSEATDELPSPTGYFDDMPELITKRSDECRLGARRPSILADRGTTSLGRTPAQIHLSDEVSACPFGSMAIDMDHQRVNTWRTRHPRPRLQAPGLHLAATESRFRSY